MNKYDNPFQDLIELNDRFARIEAKKTQIDKGSDEIEKRKKNIFEKVIEIDNKSIPIPSNVETYMSVLMIKVEERKKIKIEWDNLRNKRVEMDKYTEGLEKIVLERGGYKPNLAERQETELLLKQYEEITIKQESLLNKRIQIQEEEKAALSEIEKIIARIK